MQTFMLNPDTLTHSACGLDRERLGKQRVEAYQILKTLDAYHTYNGSPESKPKYSWSGHPAVLMWYSYEKALIAYAVATCAAWIHRGYSDTIIDKLKRRYYPTLSGEWEYDVPWWWTNLKSRHALVSSHQRSVHTKAYWAWLTRGADSYAFYTNCQSRLVVSTEMYTTPDEIDYFWPPKRTIDLGQISHVRQRTSLEQLYDDARKGNL